MYAPLLLVMGERTARYTVYGALVLHQYTLVVYLVLTGFLTLLILVVLLSLYGFSKLIGPVYQDYEPGPCCRGTPPT